ncbi:MAG: thioredoxin family protein [Planctomycetaceae bacterium]
MRAGRPTFLMLMAGAVLAAADEPASAAEPVEVAWRDSLDEAVREAEQLQRPILVRFSASWCTHCSRMKWRTFSDEKLAAHISETFVALEIDADANEAALESLNVKLLPTTLVLTADMKELARFTGFKSADELAEGFTKVAANKPAQSPPPGLIDPAVGRAIAAARADEGFAFGGQCLVSMFENETLVPGSEAHVATHRGRNLRFASAEHKRRFEDAPEKYWPALDGLCPVSALDDQVRRDGDPRLAIVYRDRLWLFADGEREERFFRSAADYHRRLR